MKNPWASFFDDEFQPQDFLKSFPGSSGFGSINIKDFADQLWSMESAYCKPKPITVHGISASPRPFCDPALLAAMQDVNMPNRKDIIKAQGIAGIHYEEFQVSTRTIFLVKTCIIEDAQFVVV